MRLVRTLMTIMALLLTAPLAAQQPQQKSATAMTDDPAASASTPALNPADLEAWLDGFMPYALERGRVAGAVVVVVNRDGPLLEKGYGFSDVAARKPVSANATLFRPGSVSKLFTWTAVMQLVEAGKLDLDADINQYLDFKIPPYQGKPITLRNIMTHTSGFEESLRYIIGTDLKAFIPLDKLMPNALPTRVFAPGSTPAYSNYASALAGYIVQRVSGMSYDDYVEKKILGPLGMTHATFRQPLPKGFDAMMSKGYAASTGKAQPFELVYPAPAGSLSATGADMAKFMIAHLNDGRGLLKPETARMMHDYTAPRLGPLNTMALGFYEQWVNGHRAIAHAGNTQWFGTYLWLFPKEGLGLFISMNSTGTGGASSAIRAALFHKFADRYLPGTPTASRVDAETTRKHGKMIAGLYVSSRSSFTNFMSIATFLGETTITADANGKINLPSQEASGPAPRDWVETAPFVWTDLNSGERLAAEVKDGKVVRVSVDTASPFTVLEPVTPGIDTGWLMPAFQLALALVTLAAVAWPVRALVRRHYKAPFALEDKARLAWRLSRGFAWLVLLAVIGWLVLLQSVNDDWSKAGGSLDWLIQLLRFVTPLAAVGLLASSAWHLWLCVTSKRRWTMTLGAVALLLSALVLAWITYRFNLYGFGQVF